MRSRTAKLLVLALMTIAGAITSRPVADDRGGAQPRPAVSERNQPGRQFALLFDSELIRMYIRGDSLEIDGIYRFLCDTAARREQMLFYPYPQDSLLGGARMLSLEIRPAGGRWSPGRFEDTPQVHGARWWLPLTGGDSLEVRCVYRQALRSRYGRYIVTTTRRWDRPLSHARFEIYLPPGTRPDRFSFPFVEQKELGQTYWLYETDRFMPDRDIVVEWSPAAP